VKHNSRPGPKSSRCRVVVCCRKEEMGEEQELSSRESCRVLGAEGGVDLARLLTQKERPVAIEEIGPSHDSIGRLKHTSGRALVKDFHLTSQGWPEASVGLISGMHHCVLAAR
jgi:hypothetical protein